MSKLSQELDAIRRDIRSHDTQIGQLTSALVSEKEARANAEDALTKVLLEVKRALLSLRGASGSDALQQQRSSEDLVGNDLESFRYSSDGAKQRIALQGKCVEMSIQVTLGLAAAVAAATVALLHTEQKPSAPVDLLSIGEHPIVIVFLLYVFIQLMLLTNYIYHVVCLWAHDAIYGRKVTEPSVRKFITLEEESTHQSWIMRKRLSLVTILQPAVVYFSTLAGLAALYCFIRSTEEKSSWWSIVLFAAESVWFLVLFFLHKRAPHIGASLVLLRTAPRDFWGQRIPPKS
jgi:hypothetical protein